MPMVLIQGTAIYPSPIWAAFLLFVVVVVAESALIGWVYERTGRSLLSALLLHEGIRIAAVVPIVSGLAAYGVYAALRESRR